MKRIIVIILVFAFFLTIISVKVFEWRKERQSEEIRSRRTIAGFEVMEAGRLIHIDPEGDEYKIHAREGIKECVRVLELDKSQNACRLVIGMAYALIDHKEDAEFFLISGLSHEKINTRSYYEKTISISTLVYAELISEAGRPDSGILLLESLGRHRGYDRESAAAMALLLSQLDERRARDFVQTINVDDGDALIEGKICEGLRLSGKKLEAESCQVGILRGLSGLR